MNKLSIPVLLGTTRPNRRSENAWSLICEIGRRIEEIEIKPVDPLDYKFPYDGKDSENKDPLYSELTARADGFFIVTPEYNHSFPGSLKRMLDSELKNYIHKPVAFAGVSNGVFGGARAIEALVMTVREMGMIATLSDVYFPQIQKIFDEKGQLLDESVIKRIETAYQELIWMAKSLKWGRDNLKSDYH